MPYIKKITIDQFIRDVIDFELKPYGINFEYILNLQKEQKNKDEIDQNVEYQEKWFSRYKFHSFDEFNAFRQYFYEHWKDYAAQRYWKKDILYREFEWFNLQYGLATNYDFKEHLYKKNEDDMFKKVYGSQSKKNNK